MSIRNSFAVHLYLFHMSANKLSYEKFTKELRKTYDRLQSYERVTKSLRKIYETIRNSLVTFSQVHFTKFCKLGPISGVYTLHSVIKLMLYVVRKVKVKLSYSGL